MKSLTLHLCSPMIYLNVQVGDRERRRLVATDRKQMEKAPMSRPLTLTTVQVGDRERRKLVDKDRKQMEKAHQAKLAALADDENVFDVAFEQQGDGTEGATLSTTDIKVTHMLL